MTTTVGFPELALQYVLSDDPEEAKVAAQKAASMIEASTNNRVLVGQWVSSINRWMPLTSSDDGAHNGEGQDDDFISRAKALEFLASTLAVVKRDALKAEQVKLLVNFFCSLFSSDHKAGITASAKALQHLTDMNMFSPPLGNEIIEGVSKLGDDFKLQAPATRLELYQLILGLLQDESISNDLGQRHGIACDFMTGLLKLCSNERDPNNLMKWFEILKTFLQKYSPSDDVTSEVFRTFSAYFPITLRAAVTSSGITPEDLKAALRSCFSAHHRLASHAIPYLIAKLDQGDAVTVTVKVDILQTLQACVTLYDNPKQSVIPYADQIWSALKYEVRKGEVDDTIEATLKVIQFLPTRMEEDDLQVFFHTTWRDLAEDISSEKYALQAARLLVATFRETPKAFSLIELPLAHVKNTVLSTQSASHKRDLLVLLNWVLTARSNLIANHTFDESLVNPLKDELFGDTLFKDIYLTLWNASRDYAYADRMDILPKLMEGMATLVNQKSYEIEALRLVTENVCTEIFLLLSEVAIICPLEGRSFINTGPEAASDKITDNDLRYLASSALKKAMPLHPNGLKQLMLTYTKAVKENFVERCNSNSFAPEIKTVGENLCNIAYSDVSNTPLAVSESMTLIQIFLDGVFGMLLLQAPPKYWSAFISPLNVAISRSLEIIAGVAKSKEKLQPLFGEGYAEFVSTFEDVLQIKINLQERKNSVPVSQIVEDLQASGFDDRQQLLAYYLCILQKLYHCFIDKYPAPFEPPSGKGWIVGLREEFVTSDWKLAAQQDITLHQLAQLATSIVRAFSEDEQKALQLDHEAFRLFSTSFESSKKIRGRKEDFKSMAEIGSMHQYRTAPLSMGILQGLSPGALGHKNHIHALWNLKTVLFQTPTIPTSEITRVTLDTIWTILSNKFVIRGNERKTEWSDLLDDIALSFITVWSGLEDRTTPTDVIRVLRSILHFLAGDITRFQGDDPKRNGLLRLICDKGLSGPKANGRQLAKNFEILLSPQECLRKENHAIRKRLAEAWIYHQTVKPYLRRCFPSATTHEAPKTTEEVHQHVKPEDRPNETMLKLSAEATRRAISHDGGDSFIPPEEAVNRSVATFYMLKYVKFEQYADDVPQIVRIIVLSLGTLAPGVEMAACLQLLLEIMNKEPDAFNEHLPSLSRSITKVYNAANPMGPTEGRHINLDPQVTIVRNRESFESRLVSPGDYRALISCRTSVVDIFNKLPVTYKNRMLSPLRPNIARTMADALNDSVREIRQSARAASDAWNKID